MNGDAEKATNTGRATLAELVEDPLVRLMMTSDGVDRDSIETLFKRLARQRARLRQSPHPPPRR